MFVESGKLTAVKLLHHKKAFRPIVCNWELLAKLMVVKVDRPMAFVMLGGVTAFVERVLVDSFVMVPTCWKAPTTPKSRRD